MPAPAPPSVAPCAPPPPPSSIADEARRVVSLAWPVMVTSLNWTLMQLTDVALVGLVSTDQAAILGASRALSFMAIVAALGAMTGVLVFASRADGAGDLPGTGQVLRDGLVLAAGLALVIAVPTYALAAPMLAGIGVAPALIPNTAVVARIFALTLPFHLLAFAFSFFLEGISRPQRVTVVNLAVLPINAVLAWMLSGGHWGFAEMGAAGAVLATLIASALGAIGLAVAVWTLPQARARGVRAMGAAAWRGTIAGAGRLLRFGTMPAIATMLEVAGFSVLIALSTRLGDAAAHAFQIVFAVHNLTFTVAIGFGSAAGVRAGNAVGEGMPAAATRRVLIALAAALGVTAVLVVIAMLGRAQIAALFPASPSVQLMAAAMLTLWVPFILFDTAQMVLVHALRSLGDQVAAGINSILAYFVVTGGAGLVLFNAGYGPMGLVIASAAGMVAAAALHGGRFALISARARSKSSGPAV